MCSRWQLYVGEVEQNDYNLLVLLCPDPCKRTACPDDAMRCFTVSAIAGKEVLTHAQVKHGLNAQGSVLCLQSGGECLCNLPAAFTGSLPGVFEE